MDGSLIRRWLAVAVAATALAASTIGATRGGRTSAGEGRPGIAAASNPCSQFGVQPLTMQPTVPTKFNAALSQKEADCVAWQTFIALNWLADPRHPGYPDKQVPASAFGAPDNLNPTVWLSYADSGTVFQPQVAKPGLRTFDMAHPARLELHAISKFDTIDLSLSGIEQAGDGKWLTAQSGGLTYYDVRMNGDEFAYITGNVFGGSDLSTFAGQAACAGQSGRSGVGGFALPGGSGADTDCGGAKATYGQDQGAIEVKAAWIALPADGSLNYRYLTANATVTDPSGRRTTQLMGLVGMHIIHKMIGAQQLVWATFEQIDNSPDQGNSPQGWTAPGLPANPNRRPGQVFTYFNPNCSGTSDPYYGCVHNRPPGTACGPTGAPVGCVPFLAPMQITRMVTVDSTANGVTGYAWSILPARSVFNYYRLINAQWPNSSVQIQPQSVVPLPTGDIQPPSASGIVANTTMETFQQTTNSCMDCHQFATIASRSSLSLRAGPSGRRSMVKVRPAAVKAHDPAAVPNYASDYSFMFSASTLH